MKKLAYILAMTLFALAVSGCSGKIKEAKETIEKPIKDVSNYIPKEIELNKRMQNDIQNATGKENERLQKSLEDSGTNNQ